MNSMAGSPSNSIQDSHLTGEVGIVAPHTVLERFCGGGLVKLVVMQVALEARVARE